MIVAIHQPQYLPWLGYFDKMLKADVFCYLDTVQYKKNEWQNRNRIKTAEGWQWLTVPVTYHYPQKVGEVGIDNMTHWANKHLQALRTNYRRAPFFDPYIAKIEAVLSQRWERIAALNLSMIGCVREILGIAHKPAVRASEITASEDPTDRLIDICQALGADTYLAGAGANGYMNAERFAQRGVRVLIQAYEHPVYRQLFTGFQSHLSIVDLLFNCGPESAEVIKGRVTSNEQRVTSD